MLNLTSVPSVPHVMYTPQQMVSSRDETYSRTNKDVNNLHTSIAQPLRVVYYFHCSLLPYPTLPYPTLLSLPYSPWYVTWTV